MPWIIFIISTVIVVVTAIKLAQYGDVIAVRANLGGLFVGTIFLAGATSLPELIASISSFAQGEPNLAAGNFFGSNMTNMFLLAIVDLISYQVPLMRRIAITHTLTATLSIGLTAIVIISILGNVDLHIGWIGVDSLMLIALYFGGVWLIQKERRLSLVGVIQAPVAIPPQYPSLRQGIIGFAIACIVLIITVPFLVQASTEIAAITGLGTGLIGTALLGLVTSLPEFLAAFAAVRMGAFELAVGNLFGSNVFNMLGLGIADGFYSPGRLLGAIDPGFALVGMLGLLLTTMALMGNLARIERRIYFIEFDALAIIIVYLLGMALLFARGIGA